MMKTLIITVLVLLLGACVSLTEEQQFEREYARVEAQQKYAAYKRTCEAMNGVMVFYNIEMIARLRPSVWDYQRAWLAAGKLQKRQQTEVIPR